MSSAAPSSARSPADGAPDGRGPSPFDAVTALITGVVQVGGTVLAGIHQDASFTAASFGLLAAGPVALVFRRRAPVLVLAVNFVATLLYWHTSAPRGPVFIGLLVALAHASGTAGHRVAGWITLALGFVLFMWAGPVLGDEPWPNWAAVAGLAGWLLLVGGAIEVHRSWRERTIAAHRSREEEARRRASDERLRIARELHDVLAHNISLINVQAGVALHLLDSQPEQAGPALTAIKAASKEALGELRTVLDILRTPGDAAPLTPTAGLDDLDALVDRTRAAGLDVSVRTMGPRRPLPPGVDLAAYRIVQEALTNVVRHVGPTRVTIELRERGDALTITIEDDGPKPGGSSPSAAAPLAPGNGIAGMRERASALGGSLDAGRRPGGGFRVVATLPLDVADTDPTTHPPGDEVDPSTAAAHGRHASGLPSGASP
jgi:signal transduction histidine kinase